MKRLIALTLTAAAATVLASSAEARQGCGPGGHRDPYGHCRPNMRPAPPGVLVVHRYYPGQGYWDGRRYWQHRARWHHGWRYY